MVEDAAWLPAEDTAARVEAVLREWGVAGAREKVVDLTTGALLDAAALPTAPGRGFAVAYRGVDGAAVERVAGASLYGLAAGERDVARTVLAVGSDYRITWSGEGPQFLLSKPPSGRWLAIRAEQVDLPSPFGNLFAESFPSDGARRHPVVEVQVPEHSRQNVAWTTCLGFWRGAVVLDFGKDLPAFAEGKQALPERAFVQAIGDAFRGPILEVGEYF